VREQQGVSPSTVVAAYDQLLAQGLVEARKNRGFFVREAAARRSAARRRGGPRTDVRGAGRRR
jgi:DNA-binding GntR family transcriptional regulator